MKMFIAVLSCRILTFVCKIAGKGSDFPGRAVLKLFPDILKSIKFCGKVIAVTGSNGKTTTANLIAHILKDNGHTVINNVAGANIAGGLATLLLNSCNLKGNNKYDFTVLEVDERYVRFLTKYVRPDILLINNLLRDQIVRNGYPEFVMKKINDGICEGTTLVLNANDPISQLIGPDNKRVYFAMDRNNRSTEACESGTHDCKVCPKCSMPMEYEYFHYNHIGKFSCTGCDYKSPEPDFVGTDVNLDNCTIKINGEEASFCLDTMYFAFNTVSATAVCCTAGLELKNVVSSIQSFNVSAQRFDCFKSDGRDATVILTKQNSPSLEQSIAYTISQKGPKTVLLYINNILGSHYKDVSWLYDVSFWRLLGNTDYVICAGTRAYDTAVCLKNMGFDPDKLQITNDLSHLPRAVKKTEGNIYVLASYAFENENRILEVLKGI